MQPRCLKLKFSMRIENSYAVAGSSFSRVPDLAGFVDFFAG